MSRARKKRKPAQISPLASWLLAYIAEHDTTLTGLALKSDLSPRTVQKHHAREKMANRKLMSPRMIIETGEKWELS
jgi:hypothetical protein